MKDCPQAMKKQLVIDGTVYTVTSHFKDKGRTAEDQIKQMIDRATKEQKVRISI